MTQLIHRFARNTAGRDIAVGDIHGHFTRLRAALDAIAFDPARDRLFSVGDMVDRGPECLEVVRWLSRPWFHAVRGNHEDVAIRFAKGNPIDRGIYSRNGGDWFIALDASDQQHVAELFDLLPYAIEVETAAGIVGLVHANVPLADWTYLGEELLFSRSGRDRIMWDRGRIDTNDTMPVAGVRAVVVGHTPVQDPVTLGNVHHIDTAGWRDDGRFTLLDLATLEAA